MINFMYTLIYTQLYDINALEINAKNFVRTESYVTSTSIYVVTSGAVTSLECASYVISDEQIAFKHNDASSKCRRFAIPRKSASFPIFFSFNCHNFCVSIPQLRLPENTCVLHRVLDGVHSNCQHTCTRAVMRMEQKTFSANFVTIL